MVQKPLSDDQLADDIYKNPPLPVAKVLVGGLVAMFLGFAFNFPLKETIANNIQKALTQNPSCPIKASQTEISLFFPKISLKNLTVSGACFQNPNKSLLISEMNFYLSRPSFFPFGLLFKGDLKASKTQLKIDLALGIPTPRFRIVDSTIHHELLNTIIGMNDLIRGELSLQGQGKVSFAGAAEEGSFLISSKNLSISSQNVQGIVLPALPIGVLLMKLKLEEAQILKIEEFTFGNELSPISGLIEGDIRLSQSGLNYSNLDLLTTLNLSPELIQNFPILNLFLGPYQLEDTKFQFMLTGNLTSPALSKPSN